MHTSKCKPTKNLQNAVQSLFVPSTNWGLDTVQDFLIKLHAYTLHIENKHFFTKSCHRQTYQNYEQPSQKSIESF